jgi:UMF1 family MFS transporter
MTQDVAPEPKQAITVPGRAKRGEILAWAMYDVANATYGIVIATVIYNAYFVKVIAGRAPGLAGGAGTLLLTTVILISAMLIVVSAPVLGTIADALAAKKKLLMGSTACCIAATACLSLFGPGDYLPAMVVLIIANVAFGTGEDFVAAFLPELASREEMGRISALGWAAGYVGGLLALGLTFGCVRWAHHQNPPLLETQYVPILLVFCAVFFLIFSLPTFIFLKERAVPDPLARGRSYILVGFQRLRETFGHAKQYRDLFNFLITLFVFSCGTRTIVDMCSVYAQQVLRFTTDDCVLMFLVVQITAALGAVIFGFVQDRIGSIKTLKATLCVWIIAILIAYSAKAKVDLWVAANMVGIALGASGSVGRALVGQFSPRGRSGEFLGLWGVAVKLATGIGAFSFGAITYCTHNNLRLALLSTLLFFIGGLGLLLTVDEARGIRAAHEGDLANEL